MSESKLRWEIVLTRQAEKRLYRLSKNLLQPLDQALLALAEDPRPLESQPLPGYDNLYRLPVREWRVTYAVEDEHLLVLVLEISPKQQPERYQLEEELEKDFSPDPSPPPEQTVVPPITELRPQPLPGPGGDFFYRPAGLLKRLRKEKIRLLIGDYDQESRENLRQQLFGEAEIEIVGIAANGEETIQMVVEQQPDLVLLDTHLPGLDGFTTCERIVRQVPSTQIILMSVHGEADYFRRAMQAGAREFLIKPFSGLELAVSIRRVYRSAAWQRLADTRPASYLLDAFDDLKERLQARLMAELDSAMNISRPEEVRQFIQERFDPILAQENIILSRPERKRLFEALVAEILSSLDQSMRPDQEKIRLLIVADNPEILETVRQFLLPEPDIEIVGVVTSIEAAIQMTQELLPDIVFSDVNIAGVNFLQDRSATTAMVSVQEGTGYPEYSAMAGSRELLEKPYSKEELVSSIRRVYQSTRTGRASLRVYQAATKLNQLNQRLEGEEAELDETQKRTLAQWFKFYKLGPKIEISLSVTNLSKSLRFYAKLGFEKVDGGEKPYPWAVVSDGQFHLGLHQREFSSPTLSYFGRILADRMAYLPKLGVRLNHIQKLGPIIQGMQNRELLFRVKFLTAEFESPEGQRVLLADVSSDAATTPAGRKFFSKYEALVEISLKTKDVNVSVAYWKQLGFECVREGDQPYPWAVVSDGLIRLGFHQTTKLTQPTITYFVPDMPERLKRLRRKGVKFKAEQKDKQGRRVGAVIESPDGQRFFLFTGEANQPDTSEEKLGTNGRFKVGQKVRIIEGPFEDFMGIVDEVDQNQARVKVQISFFGQEKLIGFDFSEVELA